MNKDDKEHPEIPCGMYCESADIVNDEVVHTLCPYWKEKLFNGVPGAHCSFLNKDSQFQDTVLIWDKVKSCGINKIYKLNTEPLQ